MATSTFYPAAHIHLGLGRVDLLGDVLKLLLCDSSYTPAVTDTWYADITGQVTGGDYPYGGVALTGRDLADAGDGTGAAVLTCDPVMVGDPAFTYRYAVLYAEGGDPGTSPLLSYHDLGTDVDASASPPLTLTFSGAVIRLGPTAA